MSGLIYHLISGNRRKGFPWILVGVILLTNLPDFDFFPGWLVGQPNMFHRGASHSLLTAAIVGLALGWIASITRKAGFVKTASIGFALYASHILLDLFSMDFSEPKGFQIFWPFKDEYYISPTGIFLNITRSPSSSMFFTSLFNTNNLKAVINELVIFLPPILFLWGLRGRFPTIGKTVKGMCKSCENKSTDLTRAF